MNTLQGYAISVLIFMIGVAIPSPATVNEISLGNSPAIVYEGWAAKEGGVETLLAANQDTVKQSPKYPAVKNDHPGKRKEVPQDPEKRCPKWEAAFADYGLFPIETWSYIAWRESRCRIKAQNAEWDSNGNMTYHLNADKSYDTGLLQVNSSWRSRVAEVCGEWAIENRMQGLKTLDCNLKFARWLMENSKGGLSNWGM